MLIILQHFQLPSGIKRFEVFIVLILLSTDYCNFSLIIRLSIGKYKTPALYKPLLIASGWIAWTRKLEIKYPM